MASPETNGEHRADIFEGFKSQETVYCSYSCLLAVQNHCRFGLLGEGPLRFQMLERLPEGDPEPVLRAMEEGLREISSELSREGHRITITGLGPSPRVKNRRDRAVIDVVVKEGATLIQVDATYQASAVLGETSQNAVVEEKLRRVFEEAKALLGVSTATAAPVAPPHALPAARFSAGANLPQPEMAAAPAILPQMSVALDPAMPLVEMQPAAIPSAPAPEPESTKIIVPAISEPLPPPEAAASVEIVEAPMPTPVQVEDTPVPAAPIDEKMPEKPASPETAPVPAAISAGVVDEAAKTEIATTSKLAPAAVLAPVVGKGDEAKEARQALSGKPVPGSDARSEARPALSFAALPPDAKKSPSGVRWAVAAIVVLLLGLAAWFYLPHEFGQSSAAGAPAQFSSSNPPTPVQSLPEAAKPAPEEPGSQDDPKAVIQDWETALRSADAARQASFYADPVDRYFLRHNVKRDDVVSDKQTNIAKRQGDWAIALERVQVHQKPDETASIRLIKHYTIHQDGRLTSQWYVPSQLLLKRSDGHWKITSERDLGWSNTLDDIDY
jgi:ketosteroid isomerase-like protein